MYCSADLNNWWGLLKRVPERKLWKWNNLKGSRKPIVTLPMTVRLSLFFFYNFRYVLLQGKKINLFIQNEMVNVIYTFE